MNKKITVSLLFGGKSTEHEVSCRSARNVFDALDKEKYQPLLIAIDAQGHWLSPEESEAFLLRSDGLTVPLAQESVVAFVPGFGKRLINLTNKKVYDVEVVFPILHGPYGEDGTMQGLLKLADVPCVGAGVLGSAIGMDKDVMKRLLRDAGMTIADFHVMTTFGRKEFSYQDLIKSLGSPFFVKPANAGSSVGVRKVSTVEAFEAALDDAFQYDEKVLVEKFIPGREIECAVLGNEQPQASVPGEVAPTHDFYSYDAKYLDEKGAAFFIPAPISPELTDQVKDAALKAYRVLACSGMARVDFFLTKEGKLYVNEINTIPGFTSVSMYPRLWEQSGISYTELISRLIVLAQERHAAEKRLKTNVVFP